MESIKINGHFLERPLMIDDPDSARTFRDASGRSRSISYCTTASELREYLRAHPEGVIIAGVGTIFFLEPFPVSSGSVIFGADGSADILVKEGAEDIKKQLTAMDGIRAAAEDAISG